MGKAFSKDDTFAKVLLLGLEDSGKTTLLYHRKLNQAVTTVTTEGQNVEILPRMEGISLAVWDMAGGKSGRGKWEEHYADTDGIIFVLDSGEQRKFQEAKEELHKLIAHDELDGVPICVFAHKQDLEFADTPNDIVDLIGMRDVTSHDWRMFGTSTVTGTGVQQAFNEFALIVKRSMR